MSKKTRKKSTAKPSKKPTKRSAKTAVRTTFKTSKTVSVKKSSSKTAAKAKTRPEPKPKLPAKPAKTKPTARVAKSTKSSQPPASKATKPTRNPSVPAAPTGPLMEGQVAPAFDLPRDGGAHLSLRDFAGRKLVLFFYPRADTPGCTREAMDFSRLAKEFASAGADIAGVSADPPQAQESFKNKHQLKTPLVSDERLEMLKAYGVWGEKSMYGRTFLGILRTTVLIGPKGKILRIWRNVKVDGHAEEVLSAVKSL